jgi:hypothetical protein
MLNIKNITHFKVYIQILHLFECKDKRDIVLTMQNVFITGFNATFRMTVINVIAMRFWSKKD